MPNKDLPILHDTQLTEDEKTYFRRAVQAGVQSTEILNVIVIERVSNYMLQNLVGAMEKSNFVVYRISPNDIQKAYTIVKTSLRNTPLIVTHENDKNPKA